MSRTAFDDCTCKLRPCRCAFVFQPFTVEEKKKAKPRKVKRRKRAR